MPARAHGAHHPAREMHQRPIARLVAMDVVDRFEMIDVHQGDRQITARGLRQTEERLALAKPVTAIGRAGEIIGLGFLDGRRMSVPEPELLLFQPRDFLRHGHHPAVRQLGVRHPPPSPVPRVDRKTPGTDLVPTPRPHALGKVVRVCAVELDPGAGLDRHDDLAHEILRCPVVLRKKGCPVGRVGVANTIALIGQAQANGTLLQPGDEG